MRAGAGRSGRPLVGRAGHRIVHRHDAEHRPRTSGAGRCCEGIAAQVAALAELVADDLGQPLTRLRVDGGLTRSHVLMQAQADLARIPVEVYPSAHATAARRGRLRPAGPRPRPSASPRSSAPGHPSTPTSRAGPRDRAAEHLQRWKHAADAALAPEGDTPMTTPTPDVSDVVVIGAGIVGAAIARDLAGTGLSVALVEARDDVGDGTSKANTAMLHTGFDATPGTLESRLVARGYHLLGDYAEQTGIPVERTGALLVAWTDEEVDALPHLKDKAERNGYHGLRNRRRRRGVPPRPRTRRRRARPGSPCPAKRSSAPGPPTSRWPPTPSDAASVLRRGAAVTDVLPRTEATDYTTLVTTAGDIRGRWIVNAAGLGADHLDAKFGYDRFTVTPRRGELLVFDKLARPMVPCIVLAVPSSRGKGVLVSPTIYGNVMVGPDLRRPPGPHRHRHLRSRIRIPARQGPRPDADACSTKRSPRPTRACARRSTTATTSSTSTPPSATSSSAGSAPPA